MLLFENLIYNALSFTPQGGTISIAASRLESSVSDTGTGISPEHLPYIFDRFYTVRKDTREESGLGLYIVRLSVEGMGVVSRWNLSLEKEVSLQ